MKKPNKEINDICFEIKLLLQKANLVEALKTLGQASTSIMKNKTIEKLADFYLMQLSREKMHFNLGFTSKEIYDALQNKITYATLDLVNIIIEGKLTGAYLESLLGDKPIENVDEEINKDILSSQTKPYRDALLEEISFIKVLGMNEPMPLEKLFVRVHILNKITTEMRWSINELEQQLNNDNRSFNDIRTSRDGDKVINQLEKFILLGKPGGGKTTFLKYIALLNLTGSSKLSKVRLPLFISLKEYSETGARLIEYISAFFESCDIKNMSNFLKFHLKEGNFVFLFDGLDEIEDAKIDTIINDIREISRVYNKCQFVISCRIATYNYWFSTFTDVELANFSNAQIEKFIKNWFWKEPEVGDKCLMQLYSSPELKEIANSPILLTLLCIVFSELYNFPMNRSELYREAIEILLRKWDSTRRISRKQVYKELTYSRKESLISQVAFETFSKGDYFFSLNRMVDVVENFIKNILVENELIKKSEVLGIINSVEAQHGIWIKRSKGNIYSFSHLTFQEYFTAKYLVEYNENKKINELINHHIFDPRWREVFLLISNMLRKADFFMINILQQSKKIINKNKSLSNLFNAIDKRFPNAKNSFIRIQIIQSLLENSLKDLYTKYSNKAGLILPEFETCLNALKNLIYYNHSKKELLGKSEIQKLEITKSISLTKNIGQEITLYGELKTIKALNNYIRIFELISQCIAQDCYIDKKLRVAIFNDMFSNKINF